ncbi:hypothetical protein MTO96_038823 [Rhipicephalus appendiculatus]
MKPKASVFLLLACVIRVHGFIGMKNITSTCMKKPDPGPCRAYIIRWFYDKNHHVCKTFVYGGCQGNSNSFATEQKCQATCMPTSTDQGTCSIDPKPRPCNARAQLWYFDHEENACRRFTAGFCGSSANKFATCRKCMNRCSSADAHRACSLAYKKIHYKKYGISWPGEMEPRVRGPSSLMDRYMHGIVSRIAREKKPTYLPTPSQCVKPPILGYCTPLVKAWFYDHNRKICTRVDPSLCGTGKNLFATEEQCTKVCTNPVGHAQVLCLIRPVLAPQVPTHLRQRQSAKRRANRTYSKKRYAA